MKCLGICLYIVEISQINERGNLFSTIKTWTIPNFWQLILGGYHRSLLLRSLQLEGQNKQSILNRISHFSTLRIFPQQQTFLFNFVSNNNHHISFYFPFYINGLELFSQDQLRIFLISYFLIVIFFLINLLNLIFQFQIVQIFRWVMLKQFLSISCSTQIIIDFQIKKNNHFKLLRFRIQYIELN
ncbi:unnamed protein product (macronuclear) [Paramecium tetraurelia]|uniref:Transmembrane protein n=1 Tax=Paramecium tetraurelia TaxID=5888 RepID=A0E236_PARTE|nr:uncharacterized protein GSPATT00022524001 [Paramecium tetraurelia]CAK89353.1 unnamed protein product [Paramecium tetraurelia]|eukprot:XP_001456750.1 hypothetical protein (macronuclear) [Paramecium tetraurelia strain d4-2]